MVAADLGDVVWRKSSRSGSDTDCVEIAELPHTIAVRDSKDPGGAILVFQRSTWGSFITQVRTIGPNFV
ncbi:DUF397 domain-containing protein [Micromonospora sp. NBC_01699]|uniref:DUF397 domain-containing protein n=1 Tax=Micromonospora sp. NBC_01699 TaxID=2975984 RepID=UPI002E2DC37A|nr:DUF397 domain-containing protein [Micromonospora sp. NBC_01699]